MKQTWSVRFIKLLHFVRVSFKRIFVLIAVLLVGTALLSIYSFIDMINRMADIYKGNPSGIIATFGILLLIPLLSYTLEKKLGSHLQHK
jgi:uncharacterized BrkB/YihY/UPF0761 family membrane protein